MKDIRKTLGLLGLARRAGKLTLGTVATLQAMKKGKVHAVILANDVSQNTRRKVEALARVRKVPVYSLGSKADLGRQLGRDECGVLGLLDRSFTKAMGNTLD